MRNTIPIRVGVQLDEVELAVEEGNFDNRLIKYVQENDIDNTGSA